MYKLFLLIFALPLFSCAQSPKIITNMQYRMPDEAEQHEATWLQWPHHYQYGQEYPDALDQTWVDMTAALIDNEQVNIIVYNQEEKDRVEVLLEEAEVSTENITFHIYPTDDVWVRDNGPVYVRDKDNQLVISDWGFNGWGAKAEYEHCDKIPSLIANDQDLEVLNLNEIMINEGGSVEIDGHGAFMATKSSILNRNRNKGMTQEEAEAIFSQYLGVDHFIWLKGKAGLEITDMHIDGFARFANPQTILTMSEDDLAAWDVPDEDIETLYNAKTKQGQTYRKVQLPLTARNVKTTDGEDLKSKGSYINYYIANNVILVPNYEDANDDIANQIIQDLYPERTVVGIDVRNLFANGGMVHCVTQQQPKQ